MVYSPVYNALHQRRIVLFSVVWLLGLVMGTLMAAKADLSFLSGMPAVLNGRSSIVVPLLTAALPFGIAAYAALIDRYIFLYLAAGGKAAVSALCGYLLVRAFGGAGWLVQPMWQFTDLACSAVFCWFCFRCIIGGGNRKRDMILSFLLCLLALILDFLVVSPFLETLI